MNMTISASPWLLQINPHVMSLGGPPSSYATLPDIELTDRDKKAVRKQPFHGYLKIIENWSGWWFGTVIIVFHMLGMSSSQLTNIFFRGVGIPPTSDEFIEVLWSIIYWTNCKTSIGRSMAFLCPIEANHGLSVIPGSFIEPQSFTIWGNSCIDYSDQQTQVWNPGYNRLILGEISNHNQPYYVWPYYVWLCLGASKNWLWSLFILIGNMMTWFLGTSEYLVLESAGRSSVTLSHNLFSLACCCFWIYYHCYYWYYYF